MRPGLLGSLLGLVGGGILFALQLTLTPANMVLLALPVAILLGLVIGWSIRRSTRVTSKLRAALVAGGLCGLGLFLGMAAGALVYLQLPATQTYYRLYDQGLPTAGPPLNSFLAQDYVGFLSGVSGVLCVGLVVGVSALTAVLRRTTDGSM